MMSVFLITYDLKSPGQNYQSVYDYLKKYNYCKGLESVWLIDTTKTATQIRDDLMKITDTNDEIFVVKITRTWGSYNYYCADWLNDDSRVF
jgi:CRISPR/Cas system-associated endoribonuclease Cas2